MKENHNYSDRLLLSVCYLFIILFCVFVFAAMSESADICGTRVDLKITADKTCGATLTVDDYNGTLGEGCTVEIDGQGCIAIGWRICCPDTIVNYEDDNYYNATLTGVESGHENESAQAYFGSWQSSNNYKTPATGFQLTGYLEMVSWISEMGSVPGTVNVKTSGALRGYFIADGQGDIIPIQNISSGGSGTYTGGIFDSTFGGSFVPSVSHNKTFSGVFADFANNMQNTGLGSMFSVFAGGVPNTWGNTAISFSTVNYGNHSFDFASYASLWAVIGTILLVVSSYIAVRVISKGGGG